MELNRSIPIYVYKDKKTFEIFLDPGLMHSKINEERKLDPNAKFEGYVDGKLVYDFKTQTEINNECKINEKVKEEYAYIGFMVKVDSLQRFIDVLKEQFSMINTKDTIKGLKRINVKIDETKN